MRPVVVITPNHDTSDYERAVQSAGATPRVIDWTSDRVEELAASSGGLLLSGGIDMDPGSYGELPHVSVKRTDPGRDAREIGMLRAAVERDLPVLAICRGMQLLNVAFGGDLIQDIPSLFGSDVNHLVSTTRQTLAHGVRVTHDGLLWRLMRKQFSGDRRFAVNSRHHQCVGRIGPGLEVVAEAPDQVVEALECSSLRFCLAVQWHPENFWRSGEFASLFAGFVEACRSTPVRASFDRPLDAGLAADGSVDV